MTGPVVETRLAAAQARATAARARLSGTIGDLQDRARPTALARDVAETLKDRGTDIVLGLVDVAKGKPVRTGAVVALVGLFLARRQVVALVRRATAAAPAVSSPARRTGSARKGPAR